MVQNLLTLYYEYYFNKKNSNNYLNTTILYIIIIVLFPLGLRYDANLLYSISMPVICVSYFLIILLTLDHIFAEDRNYGHLLEFYFISYRKFYWFILIKIFIRWAYLSVTLSIGIFTATILFGVELIYYVDVVITLILITPFLLMIGSISSSLLIGLREKSILISLLTLPFYIPILLITITILQANIQNFALSINYLGYLMSIVIIFLIVPQVIIYALKTWSE